MLQLGCICPRGVVCIFAVPCSAVSMRELRHSTRRLLTPGAPATPDKQPPPMVVDGKGPISYSSSPIARALQKHFPFTVAVFEHSLKLIRTKLPGKGLPTDRGAKRAVFANGPIDVRSIVRELSLAFDNRTLDRHGNFG